MKFIGLTITLFAILSAPVWADVNQTEIDEESDIYIFRMGSARNVGEVYYGVDRKIGLCWISQNWAGTGLALVDCEILKKIPTIKKFIETGKVK